MGAESEERHFSPVDLSAKHLSELNINDEYSLSCYLELQRKQSRAQWLYGGYLEHRALYQSELFTLDKTCIRDIHLGIDVWTPAGTPVFCPMAGRIHSFAHNGGHLDYGYTLILQHHIEGHSFHSLYGHLSGEDLGSWEVDMEVCPGDIIATIGDKNENGGWIPHLHFQLIIDMEGNNGDYPGVCSASMLSHYKVNCPDPAMLIKKGL